MTVTFVDASVLIAAVRGSTEMARRVMAILNDPTRVFASSEFVRLEVLPKAVYHRNRNEVQLYEGFFAKVTFWAEPLEEIVQRAYHEASLLGLSAMDALHVAAAAMTQSNELITAEKRNKPIHRSGLVLVRSIHLE